MPHCCGYKIIGMSARTMAAELKGFSWVLSPMDEQFLRDKMAVVRKMSRAEQSHMAFLGDRILGMVVAHHLFGKWADEEKHISLHAASQYYVTGKAMACIFDDLELEKPAVGNPAFNVHTKADKFEALTAYLHENSSDDPQCAEMFCRLMRYVLDVGDHDCPAINTDYEVCEFDDWHRWSP